MVRHLEPAFVLILALLRPQDLVLHDRADHHREDEEPHQDQRDGHDAADDLDGVVVEGFADGECGRDERRVGEDEGVPVHREAQVTAHARPVCEDGDEEKPNGEANKVQCDRGQAPDGMTLTPKPTSTSSKQRLLGYWQSEAHLP